MYPTTVDHSEPAIYIPFHSFGYTVVSRSESIDRVLRFCRSLTSLIWPLSLAITTTELCAPEGGDQPVTGT